jgi:hypothetical protein
LINRRTIGFDDTPNSFGLGLEGNHEITFVYLLMYFNLDDVEYQNDYPLTIGNKREELLAMRTMRDAINVSIQRGYVIEVWR